MIGSGYPMIFNSDQQFVIENAVNWFFNSPEQIFQYDGPPGSGKSLVLNEIVRRLGLNLSTEVAPMSYIGAATLVMRANGLYNAKTAHSWCYHVYEEELHSGAGTGEVMYTHSGRPRTTYKFVPKTSLDPEIKLIIIDEAYCMPKTLRHIIERFGIKILACGDSHQLPPVNDYPGFLVEGKIFHLTQIMRQDNNKGDIIFLANQVANGFPLLDGYYGNSMVIEPEDLTDEMMLWSDVVICGTNNTRDIINNHIRSLMGFDSLMPSFGERMVCRNNNWNMVSKDIRGFDINLVNGMVGTIVESPGISTYNSKEQGLPMTFMCDIINTTFRCTIDKDFLLAESKDKVNFKNRFRPVYHRGQFFEFAYAITCHIAQGSQFNKVIYIEESLDPSIQRCLNLVGATRAVQQLIYVNNNPHHKWKPYPGDMDLALARERLRQQLNYMDSQYQLAKRKIDRIKYKDRRVNFSKFKRKNK